MNIHVIAVHFPIALLTIYALLELVRFRRITSLPYWFSLKGFLAIIGGGAALVARETGELLVEGFEENLPRIVTVHAQWANATTIIFGVIAALYFIAWLDRLGLLERYRVAKRLGSLATSSWMVPLALAGLVALTTTGALGGIMAFGPDTDPLARFLYDFYHLQ